MELLGALLGIAYPIAIIYWCVSGFRRDKQRGVRTVLFGGFGIYFRIFLRGFVGSVGAAVMAWFLQGLASVHVGKVHPTPLTASTAASAISDVANSCTAPFAVWCINTDTNQTGSLLVQKGVLHVVTTSADATDPNTGAKIGGSATQVALPASGYERYAFAAHNNDYQEVGALGGCCADYGGTLKPNARFVPPAAARVKIQHGSLNVTTGFDLALPTVHVTPAVESVQISRVNPRYAIVRWTGTFSRTPVGDAMGGSYGMEDAEVEAAARNLPGTSKSYTSRLFFHANDNKWEYAGVYAPGMDLKQPNQFAQVIGLVIAGIFFIGGLLLVEGVGAISHLFGRKPANEYNAVPNITTNFMGPQ